MRTDELDYQLPPSLIARQPLPQRDASRLLIVHPERDEHARFTEIASQLPQGVVLVVNDTRVIPVRLLGRKPTGGKAELLLVRRAAGEVDAWHAMGRASRAWRTGQEIHFGGNLWAEVLAASGEHGLLKVRLHSRVGDDVDQLIEQLGHVPLPPYMEREDEPEDRLRYQTVYAQHPGAVAAPTAGLHFTPQLLDAVRARGGCVLAVTLHVGPGTFKPIQCGDLDAHPMHAEEVHIRPEVAASINHALAEGRPVVAVGTTVVRALESAVGDSGDVEACRRQTDLLIQPGYRFRVIDALITNFHLPRSTLLALVYAFGGRERVRRAYNSAIMESYRFYSYGDAMYFPPETRCGGPSR
jgi:S-adenosylmethionine:tRNA ribosyltransferase-isomerase